MLSLGCFVLSCCLLLRVVSLLFLGVACCVFDGFCLIFVVVACCCLFVFVFFSFSRLFPSFVVCIVVVVLILCFVVV